jgi:hypothetical protein
MKFDLGDEVYLSRSGRTGRPPGEFGAVVAITLVDNEALVSTNGFPLGTILYTVEFGDGADALVPESDLRSATE